MQNGKQKKDLYVTIVLSESTASLLKLSLPHLNLTDPQNSRIFLISPSHYRCSKSLVDLKEENTPTTSQGVKSEILFKYQSLQEEKESRHITQDIFLYMSSDVGLFSKSNCSSKSVVYGKNIQIYILILSTLQPIYLQPRGKDKKDVR
uniref:Uncharacterized protein LOC114345435 n=1 Tax=Diabrotica virgifera virgifera TaxID=50390 RepID=A0A6P7H7Y6_DIAVI